MKRTIPILLATLAIACNREPAETTATTSNSAATAPATPAAETPTAPAVPVGTYDERDDGTQVITVGEVRVEVAADLPQRTEPVVGTPGDNVIVLNMRGWPIVVRDGLVVVAGTEFGAAPPGSVVRLAANGVSVDGELRGELP